MGDTQDDFSNLSIRARIQHKEWKARKNGYEAAAKEFDKAQSETDPLVHEFTYETDLWKGAVADPNAAAHVEALKALCAFLRIAGTTGTQRTRGPTIVPIVEKGMTGRPNAQASALEALQLYIEMDKAEPVINELLPILSNKQPKVIAACLHALTSIFHAYGCKTVPCKEVLKALPMVFGHADKNVREKAQALTVELYRWGKDAIKSFFWNDLKHVQQTDLEKLFEKYKQDPQPKPERLLRSQQEAQEAAASAGGGGGDDDAEEDRANEAEIDLVPEPVVVNVMAKVPKDLLERLGSGKWKDRKEALDDLHAAIKVPAMEDGDFDPITRGLGNCMKDANVIVVTAAANCVELFAKGLRQRFAKYKTHVFSQMIERFKEKKPAVADALGAALEACVASTGLSDCLGEITEALKHKNPQIKLGTTQLLIRVLKSTKDVPPPPDTKTIAESATKLLTESQATLRDGGAEILGTLWKIMGDRIMNPHLEGIDEIRKNKIKEFHDSAEVKAKYKPKPAAPPKPAAAPAGKKTIGKKPGLATKTAAPTARQPKVPAAAEEHRLEEPLAASSTSRLAAPKLGAAPTSRSGLKLGLAAQSPKKASPSPVEEVSLDPEPNHAPRAGVPRSLVGKRLVRPSTIGKAESDEPSTAREEMLQKIEDLTSQNTRLTEENTRIAKSHEAIISSLTSELVDSKAEKENLSSRLAESKAKEEELLSKLADAEAKIRQLQQERSNQTRTLSPPLDESLYNVRPTGMNGGPRYGRSSAAPTVSSPNRTGRGSPADGFSLHLARDNHRRPGSGYSGRMGTSDTLSDSPNGDTGSAPGAESWKRAAEVTQNLKARIELMKANQGQRTKN